MIIPLCVTIRNMSSSLIESVDPSTEPTITGAITHPGAENFSRDCDSAVPECQTAEVTGSTSSSNSANSQEQPIAVPETSEPAPETVVSSTLTAPKDWLAGLNIEQNWPLYCSFGSLLLAIAFFVTLVVIDRKKRRA